MSCVQGEISVIRGGTGDPGLRHVPARLPGSGPDISVLAAQVWAGIPIGPARAVLTELTRTSLAAEHWPGRYVLHDLLAAYAARGVDAGGDQAVHVRRAATALADRGPST
jgi:hypothetical protein